MRFRSGIFILGLIAAPASPALAAPAACVAPAEAMIDVRLPRLNMPAVWDAQYAPRGESIAFTAAAPLPDGTVMAAGTSAPAAAAPAKSVVFVKLDHRARAVTNATTAPAGEKPVALLPLGKGYLLLSTQQPDAAAKKKARLSWYDADGHFLRSAPLGEASDSIDATALSADGHQGFFVAYTATARPAASAPRGVVARYAGDGALLWRRSYSPGVANEIDGIDAVPGGALATGSLRLDDGRMAGWILRLADNGAVVWQQSYPRGRGAAFSRGAALSHDGSTVIAAGTIMPADGGPAALWLAALGGDGGVLWQRYLRHPAFDFAPFGLAVNGEGQVLAAVNAHAVKGDGNRDHLRLLALTSHGMLTGDQAYIEGAGAQGSDFALRPDGTRVIAATVTADDQPLGLEFVKGGGMVASGGTVTASALRKGWVIVAPSAQPFDDPCDK